MSVALRRPSPPDEGDASLERLRSLLPASAARAAALDEDGAFSDEDVAALEVAGLLRAPLPIAGSGQGWGTSPDGAAPLSVALRLVGRASLPLGRISSATSTPSGWS